MRSADVSAAVVGVSRPYFAMVEMPSRQPAKPALSEAEGMPALQEPALFQCCFADELIASSRNRPSTAAAVFSSDKFSSATVAVK